jgi:carboxypeptidase Taq
MALHESQSLLLEMIIGRSRAVLRYIQPLMIKHFGVEGKSWSVDNLYRLLTRVKRSLVRVDADELTYPVHIMLRYELEQDILQGKLLVKDLPDAWNALMESRLGVKPANNTEGCLQDIHWAGGAFGYFPSYAIGSVIAAQLYESLRRDVTHLDDELSVGNFANLFAWLRENIHGQAARVGTVELIKNATGKPLTGAAWLRYVESKYLVE